MLQWCVYGNEGGEKWRSIDTINEYSGVVLFEDVLVGMALMGHAHRTILTHAHPMPESPSMKGELRYVPINVSQQVDHEERGP